MFRRVPTVVGWWKGSTFCLHNYATNQAVTVRPREMTVLAALDEWITVPELEGRCRMTRRALNATLARLTTRGLVESSERAPSRIRHALATSWQDWSPAASFFHFTTKDLRYRDRFEANAAFATWQATDPMPAPVKAVAGPRTQLPAYDRSSLFPSVLLARRSWRRFGRRGLKLNQLATLLGLTWGAQRWVHVNDVRLALKTSPSGGACQSLEAYVAVRNVKGLEPRVYHYDPDAHALVGLRQRWSAAWISRCLGGQDWFADADAVVFMTSVFGRVQWKYRFPRAYRVVLLEAGHFCQTFCLTATWLGLAPFCTAALGDSLIDRSLKLDGVNESVLYVMGVGTRPGRSAWAPWPDRPGTPRTSLPEHLSVRRGHQ